MTEYKCDKCLKSFGNKKDHLQRHINKKKSCIDNKKLLKIPPQNLQIPPILCQEIEKMEKNMTDEKPDEKFNEKPDDGLPKENTFECKFCLKTFAKKFNVDRHLKICNAKKEEESKVNVSNNELKEIKEQLSLILKQNEELKKESENLKKQLTEKKTKSSKSISKTKKDININIVNNVVNNQNNITPFSLKFGTLFYKNLII